MGRQKEGPEPEAGKRWALKMPEGLGGGVVGDEGAVGGGVEVGRGEGFGLDAEVVEEVIGDGGGAGRWECAAVGFEGVGEGGGGGAFGGKGWGFGFVLGGGFRRVTEFGGTGLFPGGGGAIEGGGEFEDEVVTACGDWYGGSGTGVLGGIGPSEKPSEKVPVLIFEGGEVVAGFEECMLFLGIPVRDFGPAGAKGVDAFFQGVEGIAIGGRWRGDGVFGRHGVRD